MKHRCQDVICYNHIFVPLVEVGRCRFHEKTEEKLDTHSHVRWRKNEAAPCRRLLVLLRYDLMIPHKSDLDMTFEIVNSNDCLFFSNMFKNNHSFF